MNKITRYSILAVTIVLFIPNILCVTKTYAKSSTPLSPTITQNATKDTTKTKQSTKPDKIKQTYQQNEKKHTQTSTLKAYDKNRKLLWTYKTPSVKMTELDNISKYFRKNNLVYIIVSGHVITLNESTGKVKWKSKVDVGGSNFYAFDSKGILYVGGYYGPDIVAIDKKGKSLWSVKDASDGANYWPYKIELEKKKIKVCYSEKEGPVKGKKGTYELYEGEAFVDYNGKILDYKKKVTDTFTMSD